jgi:hypothetical protein
MEQGFGVILRLPDFRRFSGTVKLDYFTYEEMLKIGKVINEIEESRLNKSNDK